MQLALQCNVLATPQGGQRGRLRAGEHQYGIVDLCLSTWIILQPALLVWRRVDNEGDYVLENTNTGARASLYFTPCGWFSSGRYEVRLRPSPEACCALLKSLCRAALARRMLLHGDHHRTSCQPNPPSSILGDDDDRDGGWEGAKPSPPAAQVSGHITSADGKKVFALGGKWNEYLDAQRCDEEGNPLPDAETLHLWKVSHGDVLQFRAYDSGLRDNPLPDAETLHLWKVT